MAISERLRSSIVKFESGFSSLPASRREILDEGARFIASHIEAGKSASLTFICTHNSRRSHLAQAWCQVAAFHYNFPAVRAYSGGVETTACNIRAVRALERAGLSIKESSGGQNPVYIARIDDLKPSIHLYSKIYDAQENPRSGFAAMMCCSDVDERCPLVQGAEVRVPLHYRDPKEADGLPEETDTYDQRCTEIGTEMFYMISRI